MLKTQIDVDSRTESQGLQALHDTSQSVQPSMPRIPALRSSLRPVRQTGQWRERSAAIQMEFVIQKQQKEAERVYIEAEGVKRAQEIIDASLTDRLLQYNQIQVMKSLVTSPNTKVIVTDGKTPMILGQ